MFIITLGLRFSDCMAPEYSAKRSRCRAAIQWLISVRFRDGASLKNGSVRMAIGPNFQDVALVV